VVISRSLNILTKQLYLNRLRNAKMVKKDIN